MARIIKTEGDPKKKRLDKAVDNIAYAGKGGVKKYDVNTLMELMNYTKVDAPVEQGWSGVDFNSTEGESEDTSPMAFRTKKGEYRITTTDKETGKLNPAVGAMGVKKGDLEELAGRELSSKEAGEFKKLLSDPAFLQYFMEVQETEPSKRSFREVNIGNQKNMAKNQAKSAKASQKSEEQRMKEEGFTMKIINGVKYFCNTSGECKQAARDSANVK